MPRRPGPVLRPRDFVLDSPSESSRRHLSSDNPPRHRVNRPPVLEVGNEAMVSESLFAVATAHAHDDPLVISRNDLGKTSHEHSVR
jgi:hypothetical protein